MNEAVWTRHPGNRRIAVVMTSGWQKKVSLGLLLLALGGLAQQAFAADSCCAGMETAEDGNPDASPVRCQWITTTSCCDEGAATTTGSCPAFVPTPHFTCFQALAHSSPRRHWMLTLATAQTRQAAALATVVLRL